MEISVCLSNWYNLHMVMYVLFLSYWFGACRVECSSLLPVPGEASRFPLLAPQWFAGVLKSEKCTENFDELDHFKTLNSTEGDKVFAMGFMVYNENAMRQVPRLMNLKLIFTVFFIIFCRKKTHRNTGFEKITMWSMLFSVLKRST